MQSSSQSRHQSSRGQNTRQGRPIAHTPLLFTPRPPLPQGFPKLQGSVSPQGPRHRRSDERCQSPPAPARRAPGGTPRILPPPDGAAAPATRPPRTWALGPKPHVTDPRTRPGAHTPEPAGRLRPCWRPRPGRAARGGRAAPHNGRRTHRDAGAAAPPVSDPRRRGRSARKRAPAAPSAAAAASSRPGLGEPAASLPAPAAQRLLSRTSRAAPRGRARCLCRKTAAHWPAGGGACRAGPIECRPGARRRRWGRAGVTTGHSPEPPPPGPRRSWRGAGPGSREGRGRGGGGEGRGGRVCRMRPHPRRKTADSLLWLSRVNLNVDPETTCILFSFCTGFGILFLHTFLSHLVKGK